MGGVSSTAPPPQRRPNEALLSRGARPYYYHSTLEPLKTTLLSNLSLYNLPSTLSKFCTQRLKQVLVINNVSFY